MNKMKCNIKIKRRFWFGYKTYSVENFFYETHLEIKKRETVSTPDGPSEQVVVTQVPINPRLVLVLEGGRFVVISNIWNRDFKVELPQESA
jgi:hypothetical protein